jgi:putative ABC transport system permease protein
METLWQDIRYGARMLWKNPGFTAVSILVLALGIGANTAIFSVVNAVLLRPLPYNESERVLLLWEKAPEMETSVSYPNFVDWRDQSTHFEQIAVFRRDSFNLTGSGESERLLGRMVSASFFKVLRVQPFLGRDFTADEDRPGGTPVVILTHGLWKRRFGSDPHVIGKQLLLNEKPYQVIGIAPANFEFLSGADLFVPVGQFVTDHWNRGNHPGMYVIARMKPDVTMDQVGAQLSTIAGRLAKQYPETNEGRTIPYHTLHEEVVSEIRPSLFVLLGAVGFVLLIACANVANMLLSRTAARQKEIAIRTALGAGRWRLVRQVLTETVILALIGGAIGLLLAVWGIELLKSFQPENLPRISEISLDWRVLNFTFLVSLFTGLLFGFFPAIQFSRADVNESMKEGSTRVSGGTFQKRMRNGLVISEFAFALMLLIGAGLMIRSFGRIQGIDPGFTPDHLLTMQLSITVDPQEPQKTFQFFDLVQQRIRSLPGVKSVAFSNGLPFAGAVEDSFQIEGRAKPKSGEEGMGVLYIVTSDYFKTMGIRLLKGRYFSENAHNGGTFETMIDETFAKKHFPNEDPIGKRVIGGPEIPPFEIIGVVNHVKHYGLETVAPVGPQFYYSVDQVPPKYISMVADRMNLIVRTGTDPIALSSAVRNEIFSVDRNQPVYDIQTMEQRMSSSVAARRFSMFLLGVFSGLALLLAAIGIYGVISYSVVQRSHEIGIRMALGAGKNEVLKMVVGQGMLLAVIGVVAGLLLALGLSRFLASMVFGVSALDPMTFVGVTFLLSAIAFLATYIPAKRATRIDPMIALRYE